MTTHTAADQLAEAARAAYEDLRNMRHGRQVRKDPDALDAMLAAALRRHDEERGARATFDEKMAKWFETRATEDPDYSMGYPEDEELFDAYAKLLAARQAATGRKGAP